MTTTTIEPTADHPKPTLAARVDRYLQLFCEGDPFAAMPEAVEALKDEVAERFPHWWATVGADTFDYEAATYTGERFESWSHDQPIKGFPLDVRLSDLMLARTQDATVTLFRSYRYNNQADPQAVFEERKGRFQQNPEREVARALAAYCWYEIVKPNLGLLDFQEAHYRMHKHAMAASKALFGVDMEHSPTDRDLQLALAHSAAAQALHAAMHLDGNGEVTINGKVNVQGAVRTS